MKSMMVAVGIFGLAFVLPKPPQIELISSNPISDSTFVTLRQDIIIETVKKPTGPAKPLKRTDIVPTHVTILQITEDTTKAVTTNQLISTVDGTGYPTNTIEPISDDNGTVDVAPAFILNPEVMPHYEGGISEMMKFLKSKLRYPIRASRRSIEGTVFISFVVDRNNNVTRVEVIKGIDPDCDKEAIRVISMMNAWTAGIQNKSPVSVKMVLPIKFAVGR